MRAYVAALQGSASRTIALAQEALACLPERDAANRSFVSFTLGGACWLTGDLAGARRAFAEASRLGEEAGNIHVAVPALGALAYLHELSGQLHQAAELHRNAIRLAAGQRGQSLPVAAQAHTGLGNLLYEWNDLATAAYHLETASALVEMLGQADTLVASQIALARLRQARGDWEAALKQTGKAEQVVGSVTLTPSTAALWAAHQMRMALVRGGPASAARLAQDRGLALSEDYQPLRAPEYLMLARVRLAQGEPDAAQALLARLLPPTESAGQMGRVIELLMLEALTLQAKGDLPKALTALGRALALAEPEGYMRMFLDEGAPMAELLRHAGSRGIAPKYVAKLLSEFDKVSGVVPTTNQPLIEPLSDRELEVLRLLAAGKSNQEIAAELVLATGTVKRHLNNIFGKLSVQSRTECAVRARELGLL